MQELLSSLSLGKLGLGQPRLQAQTKAKKMLPTFLKISYFYIGNPVDKPQMLLNSGEINFLRLY